jgi:O-acetyl-ADP-ribose deacetylase (regulator of RNase III)
MSIKTQEGDITKVSCDAIVNPANSRGIMGGGVALAIKRVGGPDIEMEAKLKAPIPVGEACTTSAGSLPCKRVIHAPTMKEPAQRIDPENVKKAVKAAFIVAEKESLADVAMPGMGTGVGGILIGVGARIMVSEAKKYPHLNISFVDVNPKLVEAIKNEIGKGSK